MYGNFDFWVNSCVQLIGVYFKLSSEVQKLQGRVALLEKSESETKQILNELLSKVNEIKLLLASNQIK